VNYKIILLECTEKEMGERLADKRAQPELFNDDMRNWVRFLRNQARELGAKVIDTTV
jgi:flavin-dependent dehydrogenase